MQIKVKNQSVLKSRNERTDGQMDGQTDATNRNTFPDNAVGKNKE